MAAYEGYLGAEYLEPGEQRVIGTLPPEALLDYEGLTVTVQPAETVLDGRLADQAALNGRISY